MTTRGIVMIAMGAEYERLAANTLRASWANIACPVAVIFNRVDPAGDWRGLEAIRRVVVDCPTDYNREVKTQLHKYTPFASTLYIDADSVIQRRGIEEIFGMLKGANIVFQRHFTWEKHKKYYDIYRRAFKKFDCQLPATIMIGGFFAFRNTPDVARFFDLWNEYWDDFGRGRDMPPLACAVQNSGVAHGTISSADNFFSFGFKADAIAVHRVHKEDLLLRFGVAVHKQNKPFDGDRGDWEKVHFDDIDNTWLKKKVSVALQDKRERAYIEQYLHALRDGGKRVLDLGCGFGQFLLICRRCGNEVHGVVPPIEDYESKKGVPNSDGYEYELFCRERLEKNRIAHTAADLERVIIDLVPLDVGVGYDVINCKHAINLIFRHAFDFGGPIATYKNDGAWVIDGAFKLAFTRLFGFVADRLRLGGVFMLSALNARNVAEYAAEVERIAGECGFYVEAFKDGLVHRFTLPGGAK